MHIEGSSGNINYEIAQMYYVHIRVNEYYTLDEANNAWEQHAMKKGHRIPQVYAGVKKGTTDWKPHSGTTANLSASQAFVFVQYRCVGHSRARCLGRSNLRTCGAM